MWLEHITSSELPNTQNSDILPELNLQKYCTSEANPNVQVSAAGLAQSQSPHLTIDGTTVFFIISPGSFWRHLWCSASWQRLQWLFAFPRNVAGLVWPSKQSQHSSKGAVNMVRWLNPHQRGQMSISQSGTHQSPQQRLQPTQQNMKRSTKILHFCLNWFQWLFHLLHQLSHSPRECSDFCWHFHFTIFLFLKAIPEIFVLKGISYIYCDIISLFELSYFF